MTQTELRDYHRQHGISTQAWSPIGRGGPLLHDDVITSLADTYSRTPAQIVLRWQLQQGNVAIPKSVMPSRIVENFEVFDFELRAEDVGVISELNRDQRTGPDPDTFNP